MDTIAPDLAKRVWHNYLLASILLLAATALAVAALVSEITARTMIFPPGLYFFSPVYTLSAIAVAWVGVIFWLIQARALNAPGPSQYSPTIYGRIWALQSMTGPVVSVGAAVMVPGSLIALQMGLVGLAVVFPLFAGALLHLIANRINKDVRADAQGSPRAFFTRPAKGDSVVKPDERAPKPPIAPAVFFGLSIAVLAVYLLNEFIQLVLLRQGLAVGGSTHGALLYTGFSQVLTMFVFDPLSVFVIGMTALNLYRGIPRRTGILTITFAALGLVLSPGQLSGALGNAFGASSIDEQNLLEPQSALSSIASYRSMNAVSPDSKYLDNSYVVDSLLHDFHYDMELPMFADESGAVRWLQFDYPQGVICVYIGTDLRSETDPSDMTQVGSLDDMNFFGDFAATECTGTRTVFYRFE